MNTNIIDIFETTQLNIIYEKILLLNFNTNIINGLWWG